MEGGENDMKNNKKTYMEKEQSTRKKWLNKSKSKFSIMKIVGKHAVEVKWAFISKHEGLIFGSNSWNWNDRSN